MKTKKILALITGASLLSGVITAVPASAASVVPGSRVAIPSGWTSVASDDMSSYGVANVKNNKLGNWTIQNAGDGVDVVDISTEQAIDSGTGKALKLNADGDAADYTPTSLQAPFLVKMDFYDSAPQTTKGTTIMTQYSNGVSSDYFVLGYNMGGTHYGIRHGGSEWRKSTVARSKKWHEYAVYADSSGNLKYYLDGVDITGNALSLGDSSLNLIQFRAAWGSAQKVTDNVCYLTNLNIYKPGGTSPDTYPVPEDAKLLKSDDLSTYNVGTITAATPWSLGTINAAQNFGKIVELVGGGKAVMIDSASQGAAYTLDTPLKAPFLVTMKFYDPDSSVTNGATYQVNYSNGQYDWLAINGNGALAEKYRGRLNASGGDFASNIARTTGWHEFAVKADSNGVVRYYIDGAEMANNITKTLSADQTVVGVSIRGAGWSHANQTGYMTDLNFYQLKPEFTAAVSGSTATVTLPENGYYSSYTAAVAAFNGDQFLNCEYLPSTNITGTKGTLELSAAGATKLVCCIWADLEDIQPLADVQTIPLQ